jgi:photosystem II stability/assembly factor-like uncharacterized protein
LETKDIGRNWSAITTGAGADLIRTVCYLGNGISLFGTATGHVWRSTDYGNTWTDLGDITGAFLVHNICYLGNGIVILGDDNGHEWRSTDFGVTWTDIGDVSGGTNRNLTSFSYLGNGVAILTTHNQGPGIFSVSIRISTDYGLTWAIRRVDDLAGGQGYESSTYIENGIVLAGRSDGHVFRAVDNGNTWTDLGDITTTGAAIFTFSYLGNGIVIFGTNDNHIFRSVDYGATWVDLGDITGSIIFSSSYLGNGIVVVSTFNAHIWRSTNFGLLWTDLGIIGAAGSLWTVLYASDGIVIAGGQFTVGSTKKLVRSDVAYKLDENSVGFNSFLKLTDTPTSYTGSGGKLVAVNAGETALEFSSIIPFSGCNAYSSVDIPIAAFVFVTLPFNSELFDTDNYHDNAINNSRLTISRTGYYTVHFHFLVDTSGAFHQWQLLNKGVKIAASGNNFYNGSGDIQYSTIIHLTIGDYLEIQLKSFTGPSTVLGTGVLVDHDPSFQIHFLGV